MAWGIPLRCSTRDIDVQGSNNNSIENNISIVKNICLEYVKPDGMLFDPDSVRGEEINNFSEHKGGKIFLLEILEMHQFNYIWI